MRRPVLVTLVVLGSLISLIGSSGIFAALTDTAQTGVNSVNSGTLASSADLQIAAGSPGSCGAYSEDLTTAVITASGVEPGDLSTAYVCVKNVGSASVTLSLAAIELTDVDTLCTGDEAEYDLTCGGLQAGELSPNLSVFLSFLDCDTGSPIGPVGSTMTLASLGSTPMGLLSFGMGTTGCFAINVLYPSTTAADAVQAAQSDSVTWRFQFIADA